ncbi:uncharacterized protein V6R79_001465 [Siganus canaliculatus]
MTDNINGDKMDKDRRKTENQKRAADRGQWASKREYILVVAGDVVGLGNVWRFPYLCYKNGGGAFLMPYILLTVLCGMPLFLLETSIGQYTQEGFITCWRTLCPLAQGIGFGILIISLCCFIYILIEVWALFYLMFSFRSQLPWANCENAWNTANCHGLQSKNATAALSNSTSAATEFWEHRVLGMSGGIEELGSVRWELALCLLACWVFCYFSIWKGVRSSGKVAYFTATFPYVMLLILLIRGLTLPGAWDGIYYYLYPDLNRLSNLEVWIEAGSQIFFSYSLTAGGLHVLASYNHYNNNCYKDCFWICLLNSGTSFVAGFVVFSVLGFMAQKQGVTVDTVVESGPGLAFIAYPQATALMPLPQFWTVCFFLMLILLAVDTHFVIVESFITTVTDLFPKLFRAPVRREIFVLVVCVSSFLIHLTLVTEGGIYVFQLIDFYGSTRVCQNFIAICECLAVGWIFGADHFSDIVETMSGMKISVFFKLCWKYIIPVLSATSLILYLVDYKHLRINDWYMYPGWAYGLGWTLTLSSVLMVPLFAGGQMYLAAGTFKQRLWWERFRRNLQKAALPYRVTCLLDTTGAFLVPYGLLVVLFGIPLFLQGISIGIGYGNLIIKLYDFSYIMIQVWALFYLMFSFRSQLPWATCDNTWNTANCIGLQNSPSINMTNKTTLKNTTSAAEEFWEDCFWFCLINSGTSFLAGFVVFSVLGFMAQNQGVPVDAVAESGPGLAFIAYPQATALMPLPQFWTVCFFLMVIFLTVDTHGGIYIFQLIDYYGITRVCHYFMVLSECLALAWIFGSDRVINIIDDMTGQRPSVLFKLCWKYIIPLLSLTSLILYLVDYKHLRINNSYIYPDWAYALGWTMTFSSLVMVPLWAAGQMCLTAGTFRQGISIGQYTQEGFITCWKKLCPLAKGIGYGNLVIKLYDFSYIMIQVWALFYLMFSFRSQIPWATCDNIWNTDNCIGLQNSPSINVTNKTTLKNTTSAAEEFWERRMLGMSGGIEELGSVAYFTATFPYVMLLILLIRGLTLPGAWGGIYYYLYPDLKHLANLEGGIYIFQLIDYYGITRVCHYFMVLSECLALAWIFGSDRVINIIEDMTGHRPSVFFKLCWKYIIPLLSLISLILYLVDYKHPQINNSYIYPDWAYALGWTMTLSSLVMVPLWAAGQMCLTAGTFRQDTNVFYTAPCHRKVQQILDLQKMDGACGFVRSRQRRKRERPGNVEDREQWANKTEYILVVAGNVVGLGNVWRFPYLCYKNGGGAFLVPYGLLTVLCGIPLFLLESSVGQYTQEGFITCWKKLCPLAQGIGYANLVIKLYDFSYIVIQVWALFYLMFSFRSQIPWATCDNIWNTDNCIGLQNSPSIDMTNMTTLKNTTSAAEEFWERRVLGMSGGIEELGSVRWELALCLLASWTFCCFSIWRGVRSSGKVAYFTATFPYVMLLILLIRGLTLPGAWKGIYYYLYPDLNRLADLEVWTEAGSQICFSFSVTLGVLNVLGSYNNYNNNCYKDCFWLCLLNSGTSFLAGFVVFSVLGFMAQNQGVTVDDVAESGPGLAFIAYPQATALMPLPQFWTVCFFLMLIFLSVDTHFVAVECFITSVSDLFPKMFRKPGSHEVFVLVVCSFFFVVHLLLVSEGGIYIFLLLDYYATTRVCHYFMAFSQCVVLAWIFGSDCVIDMIEDMTGHRPSVFFKLCWKYIIPLLSLRLVILCHPVEDWQRRGTEDEGTAVELISSAATT